MPKERDIAMQKFSISSFRYRELKNFCYQYAEWKNEAERIGGGAQLKGLSYDGTGRRAPGAGSPTENTAVRLHMLKEKMQMVEEAAREASEEFWRDILLYVTNPDINYRYLERTRKIPCSRRTFYNCRRRFFYYLDRKRW